METDIMRFDNIPSTKQEQRQLAEALTQKVADGDVSPISAYVQMKSLGNVIDSFLKNKEVKDLAIAEIERYGKGETPSFRGATLRTGETGVKYDFTVCGDPVWNDLNGQLEQIKCQMSVREKYLKNIQSPKVEIDEATGEIYTLYPPARQSTTSVIVTYK